MFVAGQHQTGVIPPMLFVGPKGQGKTSVAKAVGSELKNLDGSNRKLITINCASIRRASFSTFAEEVIDTYVTDQEVTLFFDEASEISADIMMALLTILEPNQEDKTTFVKGHHSYSFDFSKTSFMFATTEPHKMFHALRDRLERIDLEEYSPMQLAQIMLLNTDIQIEEEILVEVASVLRGNARKATQMAKHIKNYLSGNGGGLFGQNEWNGFKTAMGINPLGLSPMEIKVLKCLQSRYETTLTVLSALTGMTKNSLQQDGESYLQKLSLIEIHPTGRRLSAKGKSYLINLEKQ